MFQDQSTNTHIHLGAFLDQIFNHDCSLDGIGQMTEGKPGALLLPEKRRHDEPNNSFSNGSPGTGNIVILGEPGTGKTTLALHIAAMCALREENGNIFSAYITLEENYARLKEKGKHFGWDSYIQPMFSLKEVTSPPPPDVLGKWLSQSLQFGIEQVKDELIFQDKKTEWEVFQKEKKRPVLIPFLSPRGATNPEQSLFWERYYQLQTFLTAAEFLREHPNKDLRYDLRVVCVDSLSVFGEHLLNREEILRIFDLFSQKGVLGVFIAEDRSRFTSSVNEQYMETIDNLADVVVQLKNEYQGDYFRRNIEILKSRYVKNLLGKHAFRIASKTSEANSDTLTTPEFQEQEIRNKEGILPLLSIDYILWASNQRNKVSPDAKPPEDQRALFGKHPLNLLLPPNYKQDWTIAIEGPRLTFKTAIGVNYLLNGIFHEGDTQSNSAGNSLLIRLYDTPLLSVLRPFYGQTRLLYHFAKNWRREKQRCLNEYYQCVHYSRGFWQGIYQDHQYDLIPVETLGNISNANAVGGLVELNIKTGKLLPEEVLIYIWEILFLAEKNKTPITRVFLDDISSIGISYPAIYANPSFLQALSRMLRERKIGLVISGTTGEHQKCDEMINQAKNIANTVITSELCEIYGEKFVTLSGEGLNAGQTKHSLAQMETVPLTLRAAEGYHDDTGKDIAFVVDNEQLSGLTGFRSPNKKITRPGITFYLFEEGKLQKEYNDKLNYKLQMCFGKPNQDGLEDSKPRYIDDDSTKRKDDDSAEGKVELIRFDAAYAPSCFNAAEQLYKYGYPINRTVISVLDEYAIKFCQNRFSPLFKDRSGKTVSVLPYYQNVLLLALKKNSFRYPQNKCITWKLLDDNNINFYTKADETINCSFLDALYSSGFELHDGIKSYKDFVDYLDGFLNDPNNSFEQFRAIANIFRRWKVSKNDANNQTHLQSNGWVGWYTEIIDMFKEKNISDEFDILALPSGGFQGDWYIGVLKGSASLSLGQKAVDLICHQREEFLRYYSGVGLPSSLNCHTPPHSVSAAFNAMNNNESFNLQNILGIHQKAKKRGDIPGYIHFRTLIYFLVSDLASVTKEEFATRIRRFSEQLKHIKPFDDETIID